VASVRNPILIGLIYDLRVMVDEFFHAEGGGWRAAPSSAAFSGAMNDVVRAM
jgi:hypothetical protein